MSWREVVATENTVSKMPQVYNPETGEDEWQSPTVDSPQRSVRAADKQTANELKERQTKELQSFIMQQIEPELKEMSATGRTQLRISPNKIHSFPSLERMGSNELMSQLDKLLGSAFTLGSDGEDLIVDIGRGRDVTRQGKVVHPETGEPATMGQRLKTKKDRLMGRVSETLGRNVGNKKFRAAHDERKSVETVTVIEDAILKAKEVIQEAEHLGYVGMKDDLTGEEVKLKRAKKNPAEEKLDNPQIEGYGHAGSKHYIGKELLDRYNSIQEKMISINDKISKNWQDNDLASRRELIEKRTNIERSLESTGAHVLDAYVVKAIDTMKQRLNDGSIVKSSDMYQILKNAIDELETLHQQWKDGLITDAQYVRATRRLKLIGMSGEGDTTGHGDFAEAGELTESGETPQEESNRRLDLGEDF